MRPSKVNVEKFLAKWQLILRLRDWDIRPVIVKKKWRKSGDIKIDLDNRIAVLLINHAPKCENLEEVIVHELLHLKLYEMDQMIEEMLGVVYGSRLDKKKQIAYSRFMAALESTVQDLTKGYLTASGCRKPLSLGKLRDLVAEEIGA